MTASASPTYARTCARVECALGALTIWHGSLVTGVALWGLWLAERATDAPDRGEAALNFGFLLLLGLFVTGTGVFGLLWKPHAWGWAIVPSVWASTAAFMAPLPLLVTLPIGATGLAGIALFLWRLHRVGADARLAPREPNRR